MNMRAFVLTRYGGPDATELREVPEPQPGPREILVRVHAAGLNPVDYKIREGKLKGIHRYPLPTVLGNEFAGTVQALGDGAARFAEGDRVFARVEKERLGAFAELACVGEDLAAKMPPSLRLDAQARVPLV